MKKVVLTGASGLIGKQAICPLKESGFEIIYLNRDNCDLFDENSIKDFLKLHKPTHLLHFAWDTKKGYLESEINNKYLEAGINLLKYFGEYGGKKAVFAGTCFEYKFKDEPLKETDELNPTTLYAKSKIKLMEKGFELSEKLGFDFGWGRIFYVFGSNEHPNRLTPYIINNLKNNSTVEIKCSQLIKDYMYTKDIAAAFTSFLNSEISGIVNISTAKGISLGDFAYEIAKQMNKENLLILKKEKTIEPLKIIGDNKKLKYDINFTPKYSLKEAVCDILHKS